MTTPIYVLNGPNLNRLGTREIRGLSTCQPMCAPRCCHPAPGFEITSPRFEGVMSVTTPIYVLNGPNQNRLGTREPTIYGTTTHVEIESMCRKAARHRPLEFRQSNAEFQLVEWVHEAIDAEAAGIIINPAGLTFTSVPLFDALKMFVGPIFELHISNIHRREDVYQRSLISRVATAVIMGLGADGYQTAVEAMVRRVPASGDGRPDN